MAVCIPWLATILPAQWLTAAVIPEAMVVVGQVVVTSNLPARGVPLGP